jgi:hypothetical protein
MQEVLSLFLGNRRKIEQIFEALPVCRKTSFKIFKIAFAEIEAEGIAGPTNFFFLDFQEQLRVRLGQDFLRLKVRESFFYCSHIGQKRQAEKENAVCGSGSPIAIAPAVAKRPKESPEINRMDLKFPREIHTQNFRPGSKR